MEEDERRKQPKGTSIVSPRKTAEDDDDDEDDWDVTLNRYSGTGPLCMATQALRTWLPSACPLGDKSHSPIEAPQNHLSAYASPRRRAGSFIPHESRTTSVQSSRISRMGISGAATRSSMAATAATPISLHGW